MNIVNSIFCCFNPCIQEADAEEKNSSEFSHLLDKRVDVSTARKLIQLCDKINQSSPEDWNAIKIEISSIKQNQSDMSTIAAINKVDQQFKKFQRAYLDNLAEKLGEKSELLLGQADKALLTSDITMLENVERHLQQLDVAQQKLANLEKLYLSIDEE